MKIKVFYRQGSKNTWNFWLDSSFHWAHRLDYELIFTASHQIPNKKATITGLLNDETARKTLMEKLFPNFEKANYKLEDFEFTPYQND